MHYARFMKYGDPSIVQTSEYSPTCSVEGCNLKHKGKGFCNTHLHRWRRNGDPGTAEILPVGKHKERGKQGKITDGQRVEIKKLYKKEKAVSGKPNEFSLSSLAKMFGVSPTLILKVINNK